MALSRMSDQIGRVLDGRYRLVAPIGTGASGRVYLADDVRLRRRVAIKVLHPTLADDEQFLRRFQTEAQSAAALNNPHIMAVYDWGHDDVPYLVTEYLGGGSLRSVLDAEGTLSLSQALLVGLEATRGLEYAHTRGFVHRDIKPANLLFGDDQRLRIADFGLARALAEAGWTEPSGAVLGTARYASPEQAKGETVDGKADVYSLGLTLIEVIGGSVPFSADTTIATLMARIDSPVELDSAFGPLRAVLERACRPDPAERPDAGELAVSFMAAAESLPRPEPIPLVGALTDLADDAEELDLTSLSPLDVSPGPTVAVPVVGGETTKGESGAGGDGDTGVVAEKAPSRRAARKAQRAERRAARAADPDTRRRRWPWVLVALFVVAASAGAAAYAATQLRTPMYVVDDYRGAVATTVSDLVADYGWTVEFREARETGSVVSSVLRQDPEPGVEMAEGPESVLVIWVSIGNAITEVPADLEGSPLEEALTRIRAAELEPVELDPEHHEEIPEGHVVSVSHSAVLAEGDTVELVASLGPRPRLVPDVTGVVAYDQMAAEIEAEGLVPERTTTSSESIPEGAVIRLEPGSGTEVARGTTVTVVVSTGMPFVTVPDVSGMSESEAADSLESAGFEIGDRIGPARRPVLTTDPPAGEEHRMGTTVNIITRST